LRDKKKNEKKINFILPFVSRTDILCSMKSRKNSGIESPDDARMTERVTLALPSSLVRSIDEIAKKTERNRSAQIRFFLRDAVMRRNTDAEAPIPGGRAFENRRGAGGATAGAVK